MDKKDKDLKNMFKKQLKAQLLMNLLNTVLILIFMMFFYKNVPVVVFLSISIVLMWIYVFLKMYYLKKAIKKMEEDDKIIIDHKD